MFLHQCEPVLHFKQVNTINVINAFFLLTCTKKKRGLFKFRHILNLDTTGSHLQCKIACGTKVNAFFKGHFLETAIGNTWCPLGSPRNSPSKFKRSFKIVSSKLASKCCISLWRNGWMCGSFPSQKIIQMCTCAWGAPINPIRAQEYKTFWPNLNRKHINIHFDNSFIL